MQVYQTDHNHIFIGITTADPNPLEEGEFILPGGCVATPPPAIPAGKRARWGGAAWITEDIPVVAPPPDPVLTLAERRANMSLSRRQMLLALAFEGLITPAESEAWAVSNALPAAIEAMVGALPDAMARTAARVTLATFGVAMRLDPMVPMLAAVAPVPLDDVQLDAFFTGYAGL